MRTSLYFVAVAAIFVTCLITANIIAVKIIALPFGRAVFAGVVVFPLSYIVGDVLTEVYGYRRARLVIWLGFGCNLIAVIAIGLGQILPPAPFWEAQAAYERILGYSPRILLASFMAYLTGEFTNSFVLAKMKIATRGRWLWTRTIGSTLVGEGLDSLVFATVALAGTMPQATLVDIIVTLWLVKTAYEVVATPLTYAVVTFLKKIEGLDTYDYDTDFNPFSAHL